MLEFGLIKYLSPLDDEEVSFLASFISPESLNRINIHKNKEERDRKLIARALVKTMINKYFDIPMNEQRFEVGEYGKPYLVGFPNVHFNISHSGKYVICAVSDKPVGVDVEEIRKCNPKVVRRVFSKEVRKGISESENPDLAFTKAWVIKEANLKRLGVGFAKGFDCDEDKTETFTLDDAVIAISV